MTDRYEHAKAYLADELRLVGLLTDRALARGREGGWLEGEEAPSPDDARVADAVLAIEHKLARDRESGTPYPMDVLRHRFELSLTEQRVLWCLIGYELEPRVRARMRAVATEDSRAPTIGTLLSIVYDRDADAGVVELGSQSRLFECCLVEVEPADVLAPLSQRRVRIADRVLELATGVIRLDPAIKRFARLDESTGREALVADPIAAERVRTAVTDARGLVILIGRTGSGRRSLLAKAARTSDREVLEIDGRAIAAQLQEARSQMRLLARECRLMGLIPMLSHLDALVSSGDTPDRLGLFEETFDAFTRDRDSRHPIPVEVRTRCRGAAGADRRPTHDAVGARAPEPAIRTPEVLRRGTPSLGDDPQPQASQMPGSEGRGNDPAHIEGGIRSVIEDRMAGLATRINIKQKWEDLILPDDQLTAIIELLARIRERRKVYEDWGFADKVGKGLGVSALFSGPPGTGKSMAAGLIARGLGVELYQVDLSKIVSKWIGETEKNLAALFDAAEAGHAILLFDEADALFGKRTDVKSSNDRHANQEVNYLLQRMESFTGICILTSNHESAIDEAFRRRLSLHVRFPVPESQERKRLWRALLPAAAPVAKELPLDHLAETYVMSGGNQERGPARRVPGGGRGWRDRPCASRARGTARIRVDGEDRCKQRGVSQDSALAPTELETSLKAFVDPPVTACHDPQQ